MQCTFLGPSSMFQRWNIQIRNNYGLLTEKMPTNERFQILLLVRGIKLGGAQQSSRVFSNLEELKKSLSTIPDAELVAVDLAHLPFEEQVKLVGNSSMVIGMHGAGIPSSMHMPVGTKHCCGVIEIFPEGEFKSIRGYGNMARRMGHHYERLSLSSEANRAGGAYITPSLLVELATSIKEKIAAKSSCVMPSVIADPHFNKIPAVWS